MRLSYSKAKKKIEKLFFCDTKHPDCMVSYDPTLRDVIRIYKEVNEICDYPGEKAACLEMAFDCLAQEPIVVDYKSGKIYLKLELYFDECLCLNAHSIFIRDTDKIALEVEVCDAGDNGLWPLDCTKIKSFLPDIKYFLRKYLNLIDEYNKLKEQAKRGEYININDVDYIYENDDDDIITAKEYDFLLKYISKRQGENYTLTKRWSNSSLY